MGTVKRESASASNSKIVNKRKKFQNYMLADDFWLYQFKKEIMANRGGANLPLARVKTIMKSSPEVETVTQESLFLITRATELFIMYLSKLGQRNGEDHDTVNYADLASVVLRKDSMDFLQDIVPKKIKYSEYLKLMEEEKSDDADSLF